MKRLYQLSPLAKSVLEQNREAYPRLEEMVLGACEKLASDPKLGDSAGKTGRRSYRAEPPADSGLPDALLSYTYNEKKLIVVNIRIIPSDL